MEYVQVRHEEMAAFMASAHAKFTGGVGLCYATSGPGAIHLLNGLYDAKMDHVPVVAIVGQQARASIGASYQQEVDLQTLFKDVASEYVATGTIPSQVRTIVDRAVRIAQAKRSVTCIILPNDLQLMSYEEPPMAHGSTHTGVGFPGKAQGARAGFAAASGRGAERGQEGRHAGRRRGAGRDRRSDRGGREAGRGRRQGPARQGGAARRPALCHGLARPAGHQAELGPDEGLRHLPRSSAPAFPTASSCPSPATRAACRSTSTAPTSVSAIRWR